MIVEFIQLGVKYNEQKFKLFFKDSWNYIPIFQLLAFSIKFVMTFSDKICLQQREVLGPVLESELLIDEYLNHQSLFTTTIDLALVVLGFMRIFYYLRLWPAFGLMIEMIYQTINELLVFLFFFWLWICLFAIIYMHLKIEIED
jgi:hypothetical protein